MRAFLAIVALLLAAPAALGQNVAGYAKNLAIRSTSVFTGEVFWLDVTRGRLQVSGALDAWRAEAWADLEFRGGTFFDTPEATFSSGSDPSLADLEWELASGGRYRALARVFRATLTREGNRTRVVVGRQRVAWGTGFVWTPTDLLNPLVPTSIERDEKGAVDAVTVSHETGPFSGIDVVVAGQRGFLERATARSVAARVRSHLGEYDVTLMAGYFADQWAIGGDFAGYVGNAGLRGEIAAIDGSDGWSVRAVANADYTRPDGTYGVVEVHYNGPGANRKLDYARVVGRTGGQTGLGRWYGATVVSHPFTPLFSGGAYVIANLVDGSGLIGPTVTWSVADDLDLAASVYGFFGGDDTEFGAFGSVYFATLQYYF